MSNKNFYITTPIYYVNGSPHIGHAYTTIAADVICRYKQLNSTSFFFATGTDEHGQKIYKAAQAQGMPTQEFIDNIVVRFKDLWKKLNLCYSDFIRTTEERHKKAVRYFLSELYKKGDIYQGSYDGWYCMPCESFFPESQLKDGKCPDCGRAVEYIKEICYFFKMTKYQDWLISYIKENNLISPVSKQNEVLGFLQNKLEDLCISRPKTRLAWGIPLPFDEEHVTYVWFDALINYLSIIGFPENKEKFEKYWPCDFHLIGKDILRPHAVFWPIMLHALGVQPPKKIFAHGWWTIEGEKMSKSKGNVVDPHTLVDEFGLDAVRFFLLRETPFGNDGIFSREKIINRINNDLANDLGNLVSRSIGMLLKYCNGVVPEPKAKEQGSLELELVQCAKDAFIKLETHMEKLEFSEALVAIWNYISRMNRYVEETAPWVLFKDASKKEKLEDCMYQLINSVQLISVLIFPFMPDCSLKIQQLIGTKLDIVRKQNESIENYIKRISISSGTKVEKCSPLFPKIEVE